MPMRRETVPFIIKFSPRAPPKPSTRKPARLTTIIIALLYLGDAVDVADIAVILVVGHVEGRQVALLSLTLISLLTSRRRRWS